jgi:hypothetical protein
MKKNTKTHALIIKVVLFVSVVYFALFPCFWSWTAQAPGKDELSDAVEIIMYPSAALAYAFQPYYNYCYWCQFGDGRPYEFAYEEFRNDFISEGMGYFR